MPIHWYTLRYVMSAMLTVALMAAFVFLHIQITSAQTAADLQFKIDQRASDIQALEKEIASYQKQLNEISSQASSLSATIKSLQLTQKKLEADIKVTENKIAEKNLLIQQLGGQISDKQETIEGDRRIIARSYQSINELSDKSLPELLLGEKSLSDAWHSMDSIAAVQNALVEHIASLQSAKANLEVNKKATEKVKAELTTLSKQLKDQRSVVVSTAAQQSDLLRETKQSEAQYQAMLAQKKNLKELFEREVFELESQLKLTIDPASIPHTGSGVLAWPLDAITVTQYFGNTPFATANSQIYNGKGHTGVDFRASIGTPVKASLTGTVIGVANTDAVRGCYSYGKWVMIKHDNGLSTLYAHLSLQSVSTGQRVTTGQIIGYSGNTGYTTGPHLHYGVYASEGVQIRTLGKGQSTNCVGATIPLADVKAYLNPLSYL